MREPVEDDRLELDPLIVEGVVAGDLDSFELCAAALQFRLELVGPARWQVTRRGHDQQGSACKPVCRICKAPSFAMIDDCR